MKRKIRSTIAFLLAALMLLSGLPMAASAAEPKLAAVKIEGTSLDANNRGTLDFKAQADAANGNLVSFVVKFSFDNTIIEAVKSNGDPVTSGSACFSPNADDGISVMPPAWTVNGTRTTIDVTFTNVESMSINNETLIGKFRYRVKDPAGAAQMAKGSFKLESGMEDFLVVSLKKGDTPTVAHKYTTDPETSPITLSSFTYPGWDKVTLGSIELPAAVDPVNVPVLLPTAESAAVLQLTAAAKDTDGDPMAFPANAVWSLEAPVPQGVTLSGRGNAAVLTVAPGAKAGTAKVKVASGSVTAAKDIVIQRAAETAAAVKLFTGATELTGTTDTIVIPPATAAGDNAKTYTAKAYNQYGEEMTEAPNLTFATADDKVTYADGTVTVKKGAVKGATYTLKAVSGSVEKEITIKLTDLEVDWAAMDKAVKASVVYGTKNSGAVTALPAKGTANAGVTLEGKFSVKNPDAVQNAGARQVTAVFTVTSEGDYKNVSVEKNYDVAVTKKPVTVKVADKSRKYGQDNPAWTCEVPALVGTDTAADLGLVFACTATKTSPAGTPVAITATAASDNYEVTVTPGKLTITKASITGYKTAAPTASIKASAPGNREAELKTTASLPAAVTVTFADGEAELPITWANAAEKFNPKGGSYTFKGTVTPGTNFNAYNTPLVATLTVTPVTVTGSDVPTHILVVKNTLTAAGDYTDIGMPATVALDCDNIESAAVIYTPVWSVALSALKSKPVGSTTLVKLTNIPAWLTAADEFVTVEVEVSDKFPVTVTATAPADIVYGGELGNPSAAQTEIDHGTDETAHFHYHYTGTTAAGNSYDSDEKPTEAGVYSVVATLVSDSHAGTGRDSFEITPKPLADSMIAEIPAETYNKAAHTPALTVTDGSRALTAGTDYTVAYSNNIAAGSAGVTITAKPGNYSGTAGKTFVINKAPLAEETVAVSGTGEVGRVLTAGLSGVADGEVTWQWMRDGAEIAGAAEKSYLLVSADSNKEITVKAVSKEQNYTGSTPASEGISVAKQTISGTVTISASGAAIAAGDTLTANTAGIVPAASFTYQWYRGDEPIENAIAAAYTVTGEDAGAVLKVVVTAGGDFQGAVEASVEAGKTVLSGTPAISGDTAGSAAVGTELTVTPGVAGTAGEDYEIIWTRDGEPIEGANETAYVITAADQGKTIGVKIAAKGGTYTGEVVSAGVTVPAAAPSAPEVRVTAGSGKLKVTWSAAGSNGSVITGYKLILKDKNNNVVEEITVAPETTGYEFTGLVNRDAYEVSVQVLSTAGPSAEVKKEGTPKKPSGGGSGGEPEGCPGDETCPISKFRDADAHAWYHDGVHYALETGLMNGKSNVSFAPNSVLIRAELAAILYNKAGTPGVALNTSFKDMTSSAWYASAVSWAVEEKLFSGYTNGNFGGNDSITREQLAVVLYQHAGSPAVTGSLAAFTDAGKASSYAETALKWAVSNGIMNGKGNGILDPGGYASRAEVATMLKQYLEPNA